METAELVVISIRNATGAFSDSDAGFADGKKLAQITLLLDELVILESATSNAGPF